MPFGPQQFCEFGDVMVMNAPQQSLSEETRARQAASRAYYAGYHAVLGALRSRLVNPTYRANHAEIIQWMRTARDPNLRTLGDQLEAARALRSTSDYDMSGSVSKSDAQFQVSAMRRAFIQNQQALVTLVVNEVNPPPPNGAGF